MIGTKFSPDRKYRYSLHRDLHSPQFEIDSAAFQGIGRRVCMFLMLNPSDASELEPDPTITRCCNFGRGWGFSDLLVGNLFPLVSSDPNALVDHVEPVGVEFENLLALTSMASVADLIICAWGNPPSRLSVSVPIADLLLAHKDKRRCLKKNKSGHPTHPLYLPADLRPQVWP